MNSGNIFRIETGQVSACEIVEPLVSVPAIRIERIVSRGHTAPEEGWYDQPGDEWVTVLKGRGILLFELDGVKLEMGPGDWCEIPAHCRHRVIWTDPDQDTVWLAVHYKSKQEAGSGG